MWSMCDRRGRRKTSSPCTGETSAFFHHVLHRDDAFSVFPSLCFPGEATVFFFPSLFLPGEVPGEAAAFLLPSFVLLVLSPEILCSSFFSLFPELQQLDPPHEPLAVCGAHLDCIRFKIDEESS